MQRIICREFLIGGALLIGRLTEERAPPYKTSMGVVDPELGFGEL